MRAAIIPARGGSSRIPRKNIKMFHGKPVIAYSIAAAKESGLFDGGVWVSTEDPEVAQIALANGARVIMRPSNLAEMNGAPDCGTQEVARHAVSTLQLDGVKVDRVCCIYPCAPTMTATDIWAVHTAARVTGWCGIYYVPGWLYWMTAQRLLSDPEIKDSDFGMDLSRSRYVDINTTEDWARAEQMYAEMNGVAA